MASWQYYSNIYIRIIGLMNNESVKIFRILFLCLPCMMNKISDIGMRYV